MHNMTKHHSNCLCMLFYCLDNAMIFNFKLIFFASPGSPNRSLLSKAHFAALNVHSMDDGELTF